MTQKELAEIIGVTQATVSLWVNGKTRPSPIALKLLKERLPEYYTKFNEIKKKR